jgi:hypothetical protein
MDTSGLSAHIRSILMLKDVLNDNAGNGLNWRYRYYQDDDHSSVPLIAEYDALRFLFHFYKFSPDEENKMFFSESKVDIGALISTHYQDISKHMGYTILPPEEDMNGMGYYFLSSHLTDRAYALFAMNIKNYPKSAKVYDSMGDYYRTMNNKAKAIEYYSKAYALSKNQDTKKKLQRLQKSK